MKLNGFCKINWVSYDSEICDMFLAALGNTYKVSIKIYQSNLKKCRLPDLLNKRKGMKENYFL